ALLDAAKKDSLPIVIDITRSGQVLFHAAMPGTAPDNDQWVLRKNKTVGRFQHSSFMIGRILEKSAATMEEKYLISSLEFAAHGGAFPIIIRNTGVIGTITVSGLAQEDDHALVVRVLREWLKKA
ncbi:MAG: heme-degrading domain-containing protein, partial [Clostridiaceae bacterium]|nr:heme-degrading domain-containing protein [Clostridiaceae bacterium]